MKHPESKLQISCVRWFRFQYPKLLIAAIPNGGARNAITGAILKAEGVLSGMPDLFIAYPSGRYAGLFIEMKVSKGRTSPAQDEVIEHLKNSGYAVYICRNLDEFIVTIQNYINAPAIEHN